MYKRIMRNQPIYNFQKRAKSNNQENIHVRFSSECEIRQIKRNEEERRGTKRNEEERRGTKRWGGKAPSNTRAKWNHKKKGGERNKPREAKIPRGHPKKNEIKKEKTMKTSQNQAPSLLLCFSGHFNPSLSGQVSPGVLAGVFPSVLPPILSALSSPGELDRLSMSATALVRTLPALSSPSFTVVLWYLFSALSSWKISRSISSLTTFSRLSISMWESGNPVTKRRNQFR